MTPPRNTIRRPLPYPSGSGKATYYGPASINRVTINSVNGKAFDPNKTYAVVTNNFCAAGGDTYYAFAAASSQFDTGLPLDEVLMDYITTELKGVVGEQYAQPQGRMTITLPAEEPTTPTTTPTKPESPQDRRYRRGGVRPGGRHGSRRCRGDDLQEAQGHLRNFPPLTKP